MKEPTPKSCDLLIRNARVICMDADRSFHPHGAIAITGRDIVAVGTDLELARRYRARRELDARGGIVHPGFVDGHYHVGAHLTRSTITDDPNRPAVGGRGLGGDDEESYALYSRWFNALTEEDEHVSGLLAAIEMLRCGVTCFMEAGTAFEPDAVGKAAEAVGIRALVADPFLWDMPGTVQSTTEIKRAPATTKRCLAVLGTALGRNRDPAVLVQGHIALYGLGSASDELQRAAKACADQHGVVLAQHLAFLPGEDAEPGTTALRHLLDLGTVGENSTFVHMNVLREDDLDPLLGSGASVVWHPANYMFYGVSRSIPYRMPELVRRGVPGGFGTDVAKVWSFGEGPFVAYLLARNTGDYLSADQLLEMMTMGGARAAGLHERIGSLEAGKRADLVIRNPDLAESQPGLNPAQDLMLVSRSKSVDTVLCDGEIVLRHGRSTRLDEPLVYERARRCTRQLCERIGLAA